MKKPAKMAKKKAGAFKPNPGPFRAEGKREASRAARGKILAAMFHECLKGPALAAFEDCGEDLGEDDRMFVAAVASFSSLFERQTVALETRAHAAVTTAKVNREQRESLREILELALPRVRKMLDEIQAREDEQKALKAKHAAYEAEHGHAEPMGPWSPPKCKANPPCDLPKAPHLLAGLTGMGLSQ